MSLNLIHKSHMGTLRFGSQISQKHARYHAHKLHTGLGTRDPKSFEFGLPPFYRPTMRGESYGFSRFARILVFKNALRPQK